MTGDITGFCTPFQLTVFIIAENCARRCIVLGIGDKEIAGRCIHGHEVRGSDFLFTLDIKVAVADIVEFGRRPYCAIAVSRFVVGIVGSLIVINTVIIECQARL